MINKIRELRLIWKIRMFIQRGRKGFSTEDTWSFDNYLAEVIAGGCQTLKKNIHGWPAGHYGIAVDEEPGLKEWENILDKIIDGFKNYDEYKLVFNTDEKVTKEYEDKYNEAMKLFNEVFSSLWD